MIRHFNTLIILIQGEPTLTLNTLELDAFLNNFKENARKFYLHTTITLPTILGICTTRIHAMQDTNRLIVRNGFGKLL